MDNTSAQPAERGSDSRTEPATNPGDESHEGDGTCSFFQPQGCPLLASGRELYEMILLMQHKGRDALDDAGEDVGDFPLRRNPNLSG